MDKLVFIFVGGGLGAVSRYGLGVAAGRALGTNWPYGTFAANIIGGLLMGVLVNWLALRGGADQERWRLLLGVGVLGGFTTFSAFSMETALMIRRHEWLSAGGYAVMSVIVSVLALFIGLYIARRVFA